MNLCTHSKKHGFICKKEFNNLYLHRQTVNVGSVAQLDRAVGRGFESRLNHEKQPLYRLLFFICPQYNTLIKPIWNKYINPPCWL